MSAALLALALGAAGASPAPEPAVSTENARVAALSIERANVFDPSVPGEDWWPFALANRIHILTRPHVVTHEILLPPGSPWDPVKALETERNLRSLGFIRKAELKASPSGPGALELAVRTQDSWTLLPQLGAGTEGGENYLVAGVREGNLLGLGKAVSAFHSENGADRRNELRYEDPRVWGSWRSLTGHLASTTQGREIGARLNDPFVSFADAFASDLSWSRVAEEEILFKDAQEFSKFDQNYSSVKSLLARRIGRSKTLVQRVELGTLFERQAFRPTGDTRAGTLPSDRTLSGPVAGYSWIQPKYLEEDYIDSMARVEDFNLGNEFSAGLGALPKSWGSDRDRWRLEALMQQGLPYAPGRFALGQAGVRGRLAGGAVEDGIFFANLNLFWKSRLPFPQTFVGHVEFNGTRRLDGEKQIVLGGESGLRGYKNDSFAGDKSVLVNIEDRFFLDREFFHLVYLGGVVFLDAGLVAPPGSELRLDALRSDLGAGLRLSPSRSSTGRVLRIDLAYALNDGPGKGRWVVSVRAGQGFAIFNSANRRALRQPDAVIAGDRAADRLLRR